MNILVFIGLFLLALFFLVLLPLGILFLIDTFKGDDLPTSKKAIKKICQIIGDYKGSLNNFYDLGCGRGTPSLVIKKMFPCLSVYAIDKGALRIFFTKLKAVFWGQKIFFQKKDLLTVDLKDADIIFTYLKRSLMPPLGKKLKKELKKGALVVTNTSFFPDWKPITTHIVHPKKPDFERLFIYVKE